MHTEFPVRAATIVVEIKNSQPIDLLEFTASLTALAREHESTLKDGRPDVPVEETRLLVIDIRKGSIILELLPALAPFVANAEVINTSVDFVRNLASAINVLKLPNGRLEAPKAQRLKNMQDAVQAIVRDSAGSMKIEARHQDGEVLQELIITKIEAEAVAENAATQRREIEQRSGLRYDKVLMRLHQSSVENVKVGKRTSEKGIIEQVDGSPHSLVYVSDHAGRIIKSEILAPAGNTYQKGFIVDVDVETVSGRPKVYRILDVHEVIDLDET